MIVRPSPVDPARWEPVPAPWNEPRTLLPGSHIVLLSGDPLDGLVGRRRGLELRDTLLVVSGSGTSFAYLFRRDLEGTVAETVLRYGTGALNIDGCRVEGVPRTTHAAGNCRTSVSPIYSLGAGLHGPEAPPTGRWPANLVLLHGPGCRKAGTRKVRTSTITKDYERTNQGGFSGPLPRQASVVHHGDADGMETVAAYECEDGCPVAALDQQGRDMGVHSAGVSREARREADRTGLFPLPGDGQRYGDSGGASRFFPQFESEAQLHEWLRTLLGGDAVVVSV